MSPAPARYCTDVGYEVLMDTAPVECAIPYARYGAVTTCRPQAVLPRAPGFGVRCYTSPASFLPEYCRDIGTPGHWSCLNSRSNRRNAGLCNIALLAILSYRWRFRALQRGGILITVPRKQELSLGILTQLGATSPVPVPFNFALHDLRTVALPTGFDIGVALLAYPNYPE